MKFLRMLLLAFCIFFAVANANDAKMGERNHGGQTDTYG